jgi:hypothetical protein
VYDICKRNLDIPRPGYEHLNVLWPRSLALSPPACVSMMH